jgi:hypothetical protein
MPLSTFLTMHGCSTTEIAREGMDSHGACCCSSGFGAVIAWSSFMVCGVQQTWSCSCNTLVTHISICCAVKGHYVQDSSVVYVGRMKSVVLSSSNTGTEPHSVPDGAFVARHKSTDVNALQAISALLLFHRPRSYGSFLHEPCCVQTPGGALPQGTGRCQSKLEPLARPISPGAPRHTHHRRRVVFAVPPNAVVEASSCTPSALSPTKPARPECVTRRCWHSSAVAPLSAPLLAASRASLRHPNTSDDQPRSHVDLSPTPLLPYDIVRAHLRLTCIGAAELRLHCSRIEDSPSRTLFPARPPHRLT